MKARRIGGVLLALLLFAGCAAALAAGGTTSDPLVSKSYLEGTYIPDVTAQMATRASEKTAGVYAAAENSLKQKTQALLSQVGGAETAGVQTLKREDQAVSPAGSGLLVLAGSIRVSHSGTVVDVTDGSTVASGTTLKVNHRYLAAEDTTATFTVVSEAAEAVLQGATTLNKSAASALPFTDILSTDWFYADVRFVYEKKLYNGTTATTFSPGDTMTRGMMATVLYRLAGSPAVTGTGGRFPDVSASAYYASAVMWANQKGLVQGRPDGTFGPDSPITREQLATLVYAYAGTIGGLKTSPTGDLSAFSDSGQVSGWAVDGLKWAVGQKLVQGANGKLEPGGAATRAQVAAILQRLTALL